MAKAAIKKDHQVILPIETKDIMFFVRGTSPLIMHRFSQKAWRELLLPGLKRNRSALEQSLKHDPLDEFRGALYLNRDPKASTLVHMPNGMFHGAMASAALDMPGAFKSQIERLVSVTSLNIHLYGVPQIFSAMVRNSDINRTPDVRTRPIFPRWACQVQVRFKVDPLTEAQVVNLLGAAGIIVGVGDWRPQKGGSYGRFEIVDERDAEYRDIVKTEGRKAQERAFNNPNPFDVDTDELIAWFNTEVARREKDLPSASGSINGKRGRRKAADVLEDMA